MGRELFDYAFKEYARRWAFKHPTPADLFRTLEDASGEDLDWFWRGWFYSIDKCDIAIDSLKHFTAEMKPSATSSNVKDSMVMKAMDKPMVNSFEDISKIRNREDRNIHFLTDIDTTLRDFYWKYDRGIVPGDSSLHPVNAPVTLAPADQETHRNYTGKHLYEVSFSNKGGLIMPIILEWTYADGSKEVERIPAQIWRKNESSLRKLFIKEKEVTALRLDPLRETADTDVANNNWPKINTTSKFQVFKTRQQVRGQSTGSNPMQQAQQKKAF